MYPLKWENEEHHHTDVDDFFIWNLSESSELVSYHHNLVFVNICNLLNSPPPTHSAVNMNVWRFQSFILLSNKRARVMGNRSRDINEILDVVAHNVKNANIQNSQWNEDSNSPFLRFFVVELCFQVLVILHTCRFTWKRDKILKRNSNSPWAK